VCAHLALLQKGARETFGVARASDGATREWKAAKEVGEMLTSFASVGLLVTTTARRAPVVVSASQHFKLSFLMGAF
jgi:aspartate-semialdehyde dehydrogenase